ncbi:UDP-N-acetylglucosamine 1-carboxyvinyltransferase [Candidatus Woesebacteria bacterium]|nr:UDP-N-acetylglucosamine 1-carboxyvinyltransferase [Candidatus Woesebacteria bacterium]
MAKLLVTGGNKLGGKIKIGGNKNSALKLFAAALLPDSPTQFTNVPVIRDIQVMGELIQSLGANVEGLGTNNVRIDPTTLNKWELDKELTGRIRASVVLAAPLLAKFGKAVITPPGGDQIGERLLDTHFNMMRSFGVDVKQINGKYELSWKKIPRSVDIFLEEASVTATEMGLMLGASKDITTKIDDAASEPHVRDLAQYLVKCGSKISGAGTNLITLKGNKLKGSEYSVISDHIEAGTFAIAAAITGGDVLIESIVPDDYRMMLSYLRDMSVKYKIIGKDKLRVLPSKPKPLKKRFQTRPWPGFPTDLMSPFIVLATQSKGTVLCHDWMYEWRIFFVDDLISMGANIFIADPHRVIITGGKHLEANKLICKDIRAGISIILAALTARGTSEIENIEMVDRGYENIERRLGGLGASINRINSAE